MEKVFEILKIKQVFRKGRVLEHSKNMSDS